MAQNQPRLYKEYQSKIRAALMQELGFTNIHQVPEVKKVVLNMGVGEVVQDSKKINSAADELKLIAGQKPTITKARKSVAGFKVREGMKLGAKVTLRKIMMYEFLDRLVNIALPRIKDFRGLSGKSFDGNGNFSFGIREQIVFPEVNYDRIDEIRGLDISIITSAKDDASGKALLLKLGFPIVR